MASVCARAVVTRHVREKMASTEDLANEGGNAMAADETSEQPANVEITDECEETWGFPQEELYRLALGFYKGKSPFPWPARCAVPLPEPDPHPPCHRGFVDMVDSA